MDVVNFDRYDMIIGTLFMQSNKVVLYFKNDTVWIGMQSLPTTKELVPDTNDRVRWYHTMEKKE